MHELVRIRLTWQSRAPLVHAARPVIQFLVQSFGTSRSVPASACHQPAKPQIAGQTRGQKRSARSSLVLKTMPLCGREQAERNRVPRTSGEPRCPRRWLRRVRTRSHSSSRAGAWPARRAAPWKPRLASKAEKRSALDVLAESMAGEGPSGHLGESGDYRQNGVTRAIDLRP